MQGLIQIYAHVAKKSIWAIVCQRQAKRKQQLLYSGIKKYQKQIEVK